MGFFDRISSGLHRSRDKFKEQMNILLDRGPDVDEEFWETLEETLHLERFRCRGSRCDRRGAA